jgi:hypothetical protein
MRRPGMPGTLNGSARGRSEEGRGPYTGHGGWRSAVAPFLPSHEAGVAILAPSHIVCSGKHFYARDQLHECSGGD